MTGTDTDAEVAVVGLGAWGASALWQLAARGVDVIGIERYGIGHEFGSSYGGSRMFRTACLEHPGLVPLAQRSRELWLRLERESGQPLFEQVGAVLMGAADGAVISGTLAASREHGLDVEVLDRARLAERVPAHAGLPDDHVGVFEHAGGLMRPEATITAAVRAAEAYGARVVTDTRVIAVELVAGGAVVHTPLRDLRVEQVVVTAGPWLAQLVPGLPLEVVRMPTTWFLPDQPSERFRYDRLPPFIREIDSTAAIWGHGALPDSDEVKLGLEDGGWLALDGAGGRHAGSADPDSLDRTVRDRDWSALSEILPWAVPGVGELPCRVALSPFARTPDRQFLLGRPRRDARLVIGGGCSNHGFKHATGIGEALADVVQGKETAFPLDFADPNRFL